MALDLTYDPNWKPDSKSGDVDLTYDPNWKPQGILGGLGSSLKRGIDSTVDYGKISLTDNPDEIAGIVSENIRNRPQPSAAQQKMNAEIAPYAKEASDAQGIVGNIGAYAKLYGKRAMQLAENPREFAGMVAENLPNSAPGIAGMVAGGAAGAATPVPFGAAIGGVVGGTAGGYKIEQGSSMFDQVVKEAQARGIDTNNKPAMSAMIAEKYPEFLKASQLKGVGTAGTDAVLNVATLGVAGIGERALAREARSVADLAKAGKMTGEEAASAIAGIEAKNAARNTIGQKALRGAGVAAGEMAGESLSEAAGQQLAYGKLDPLDVVDEGLLAFGQGVGMAAGRKFISPLVGATDKDSVTQEIERARAFATALNQSVGGDVNAVPTLITDLGPLQQRIDDLHGIGNARMNDAERAKYEQEFNAAFGEVVGYTTDKDGMEIPFTMGDYLNSQVRSADITRDRPKAANAVQQSESRLQQVADEETTGYVAPEIPVVGTLSAVANMAIKSGANAQNQMQQAMQAALAKQGKPEKANGPIAAATDAQVATQGAQGAGGNVPGSAGVSPSALAGNQERAGNGAEVAAPGLRPAVSAGIAGVPAGQLTPEVSRAAQPAQVAAQAAQANAPQVGAQPAAAPAAGQAIDLSGSTEQQLLWLTLHGKNGHKEAAVAELQRRGTRSPAQPERSSAKTPRKPVEQWSSDEIQARLDRGNMTADSENKLRDLLATKKPARPAPEKPAGQIAVGHAPGDAQPVTVRNGVIHIGDDPAIDYETEQDVTVPDGATPQQIADALKSSGALGRRKVFGVTPLPQMAKKAADQEPVKNEAPAAATDSEEVKASEQAPIKKDDIAALEADVESAREEWQKSHAEPVRQKLQDARAKLEAAKNATVDSVSQPKTDAAPESDEYESRVKSRIERIKASSDTADIDRILAEEYKDESRHFEGTSSVERAASNRKQDIKIDESKKAVASKRSEQERLVAEYEGGNRSNGAIESISADLREAERTAAFGADTYAESKRWTDNSAEVQRLRGLQARLNSALPEASKPDEDTRFAKNTIFTADKVAAAKARMKAKLGTMNSGIDPELLIDGMTIAGAYIESGVRKFADYAKAMVEDLGDGVKPYLLSFYEAARAYPGLNKMGMDTQEAAAKQHQAILTPEVKAAAKEVIGESPKVEKKKPANLGEAVRLKADWGVKNIDGYTRSKTGKNQETDYGPKGGIKDEFLTDAKRYLKAVSKLLEDQGFETHVDNRGKGIAAVNSNEAGPAVSGDVYLAMRRGDFGVYAEVGVSLVRGIGPNHPQGVSLMVRVTPQAKNDRTASKGMNNWLATDLSAGDLAAWFNKATAAAVQQAPEKTTGYDLSKADDKFKVATEIADFLIGGGEFKTIIEARKKISEMIGRPIEAATELAKQADETIETAVVLAGRDIVKAGRKQGRSAEVIYDRLVDLYRRQPNLAVRSSTSVRDQAYSTPVPLAYLASELAGINYDTKVLEPTAGNGMLLIGASTGNAVVNELNADRADVLRSLGFNPTERNAATEQLRHSGYPVDAVIANPPFGATKDANGDTIIYDVKPGFQTSEVDHAIVFKSLETMKDDGRAVLIVGGVQSEEEEYRREDYRGKNKRTFYYNLYNEYNVIDHFTADGGLYSKQGASYPVDIIVIDGRGKSSRDMPAADIPVIFKSYDALKEKLNGNGRVESKPVVGASGTDSGNGQSGQGDTPGLAGSTIGTGSNDGKASADRIGAEGVRNDGSTDNGRPSGSGTVSSGGQSESANTSGTVNGSTVSDANRNAESGSKASNRGNRLDDLGGTSVVNGERVESGLTDRRGQEQETGHQVAYSPHSNAASVGTLVPRAMKDSIAASLQKISDEVGSIDDYVAESLAMDVEDVKSNFSAEQIDALALAIRNAEAGKGFIIGDQTGIGKGRVVAAMIRYALVTGKTPIFVTEKPNLYSDMIRDLDDIGMTAELALDTKNPKVLITNGGESIPYTLLRTEKGEVVENNLMLRAPKAGKALDQLMQSMMSGESLGEYKVIFTTYSQLQTVKGATTTRQRFIQQFGEGNYMVFDESHNAGGAGETQARTKEQRQAEKDGQILVTGRAAFVRNLVQRAFGTFFSSATYAKRPDVMDLYSSTNMKLAVDRISQLGEAIKSGGVPMQQVVANMLTKDGQYIRRERTFAGVSYDTQETKVDKETAENMASAMRSILAFSRAKESVLKEMQKEMDREGGMLREMGGEKSSVQGANFGSIMHNLIDQMLLSLKVHDSVKHAIDRLKAGEKVVMTVSNTMGSFLEDYSEELGLSAGDPVSMSFADLYNRYLEKQRNVTIKDGAGNKRQHRLTDAELGPRLVDMFNAVLKQIDSSGFGSAPISPIDYMHNELRKAGYKTDEITGRTIALNYSSGTPILASRSANIRQRVKAVSGFNNGDTDVLILNQAGSTGLSLHASSKFKDKRKRHMIIVQAEKNIDTHMQMLGRVHRTGQVVAPAYSQMMADIPAEMRPASVLMKKMASLNANTTASRSSSVTAEGVVDFMNDYGGQVVHEYLRDNPDVLEAVGGNKVISLADDPAEAGEDDIRKFTGYIPILPIKQQEGVYRELVDRYNELIERENSLGTNKLEAKAVDLDAETISSQPVTENRGDHSVFAAPANMEKVDVKRTVKPYSSEEVSAMVAESLGGKRSYEIASQQSADLTDKATAYGREKVAKMTADGVDPVKIESQKAQLNLVLSHAKTVLSTYRIGDSISIKDQAGQFLYGVITNVEHSGRTANPAAGSAWKMHIALANGDAKSITISFSQIGSKYELRTETNVDWYNIETQSVDRIPVLDIFDKGSKVRREKRWIVTGNILAGFARFPGQIITYTKNDGTTAQGVLMSRQFDFEKEQKNAPVRIKDGNAAINLFTNGGPGVIIGTPDRNLMVAIRRGEYEITVPSSKKDGGTYYLDRGLTNIVGDFYKRGSIMSASVYTTGDLERMVNYLVKDREENIIALSNVENAKELLEGNSGAGNIASPGSMSPADKDIYGMAAEGKSAADILKFIASASRSPFYRQLAKLLLKTGINPTITVGDSKGWKFNAGEGNKYAAAYNPETNTVALFRAASAERNFLHEAMHAATIRALGKKGLAAGQMKALFEHVKKDGGLKGMYGMSDIDEFVAEAFSNPKFQDALKKIAAPKASSSTLSSAWNWFVRIVRGILGIPQGQENALSQAIEIGLGVMREDMKLRKNEASDGISPAAHGATHTLSQTRGATPSARLNMSMAKLLSHVKAEHGGTDPKFVRYNVADEGWSVSEPSKMDDVIYAMQDKQIDLKRVVQSIMATGKQIRDNFNAYLQEELFHGRAAKGVKDFLDFELRPLLAEMNKAGIDMGDFEEYLWNRHAEERNKQIGKINPDMPDGGSGIETAAARSYLAGLPADKKRTFESLAAKVEAINKNSQKVLVESGLEKQSTIDAWNGAYQHYVPLQREDVDSGHVGTGKGFSVRGSASKRAMGSGKKVVDIIANIAMQRERNIVRAEKNRVSNALLGLAMENPNADFWKVDQAPKERVVNNVAIYNVLDSDGNKVADFTNMAEADRMARSLGGEVEQTWGDRVQERIEPGFKNRDNVLLTRVNGQDHYIIFNERDERAMRMAMAMKNLDVDNLGRVLSLVGRATRWLASVNTQYNPVFGVINLIRDAQGALINLSSTPLAGEQKRVLGYTKDALVGIYKDIRAHRAGGKPSSNWAALFEEFQKEGGQTGYRDQYANAEARAESIKSELEQFKDGKAKQLARGLFGWLSDYNETMENAVRLAAYKVAKEKGMSNQQAASLAKNITVNFNRKGQMATQVGALYAFFNASVQGSARIAETLFEQHGGDIKNVRLSKKGKQILAGGIMLGAMQALLLAAAGFDDDEPPEFIRERNLILPIGGGKYLTLAMPLGLHVIPGIGRIATEFVLSGGKDPLKRIAAFGSMFADAFNPIGSAGWSLQTITPSVVDPFAALAENKDFTGKEIYREDFNKLNPTPGHARAKDVATFYSRAISEALNFITGGSEFKPGLVSWSPDSIDYLIGQVTGGVGREANKALQTAGSAYSGEDLPLYKIPLVGRFVGDTAGQSGQSAKFYDAIKQINMHEAQYKGLIKDGRSAEAREYLAENPAVRLIMAGNHAELAVRKLRTMKRDLVENDADQDKIRAIDARITETMRRFNERAGAFI